PLAIMLGTHNKAPPGNAGRDHCLRGNKPSSRPRKRPPSGEGEKTGSMRQRIGPELEVHGHGLHALAAFLKPRGAVAARGPQAAAFPAGVRIVDAAVEAL